MLKLSCKIHVLIVLLESIINSHYSLIVLLEYYRFFPVCLKA